MLGTCRICERTERDGGPAETGSYREVVEEVTSVVVVVDSGGE